MGLLCGLWSGPLPQKDMRFTAVVRGPIAPHLRPVYTAEVEASAGLSPCFC